MLSFARRCRQGKKVIAEGGFDPPTFGLWAQHAPAAPLCWVTGFKNMPFIPALGSCPDGDPTNYLHTCTNIHTRALTHTYAHPRTRKREVWLDHTQPYLIFVYCTLSSTWSLIQEQQLTTALHGFEESPIHSLEAKPTYMALERRLHTWLPSGLVLYSSQGKTSLEGCTWQNMSHTRDVNRVRVPITGAL